MPKCECPSCSLRLPPSPRSPLLTSLSRYTWEIYAKRLLDLSNVYSFWKHVSNLERSETKRYLEMLYVLRLRPLIKEVGLFWGGGCTCTWLLRGLLFVMPLTLATGFYWLWCARTCGKCACKVQVHMSASPGVNSLPRVRSTITLMWWVHALYPTRTLNLSIAVVGLCCAAVAPGAFDPG